MAEHVNIVNRTATAVPYIGNTKQQTQNTKELFDLLRPDRMSAGGGEKQQGAEKAASQLLDNIKKQLVSGDSAMVSAGLKKFLDAAAFLNNKPGSAVTNDQEWVQTMLRPENLLKELHSQQKGASVFKGEFFDSLRQLLAQIKSMNPQQQEKIKEAVVNVLRQYANTYMKAQQAEEGARPPGQNPMQQADPKAVKAAPPKTAETGLQKAENLLQKAMDTLAERLTEGGPKLSAWKTNIEEMKPNAAQVILNQIAEGKEIRQNSSMDKVLDLILAKLEESAGSDTVKLYGEQIVRGLLNTNTMNQPILHFVLPLLFEDMSAFAEMWVDPDAQGPEDGKGKNGGTGKAVRIFLTIDLEEMGKAEIDIILSGGKLYTGLYYPPDMQEAFAQAKGYITAVTQNAGYTVGDINVEALKAPHILEEIVSKPLERRMSLDAKV